MRLWFPVVDLMLSSSDDEVRAMAVRCRVAVHPDAESRGFKRLRRTQCEGGSRSPAVKNIHASRRVVLVPQNPEGTPQSIHDLASGSVSESNRAI